MKLCVILPLLRLESFSVIAIVVVEPRQSLNVEEHDYRSIATVWLIIVHVEFPRTSLAQASLALSLD